MQKLPKPTLETTTVFQVCISKIKDIHLKNRLVAVQLEIESEAKIFEIAVSNNTLHLLQPQNDVKGLVSVKEMSDVYKRMVKQGSPGRLFYDKILNSPAQGRCPLCGQRVVSTLDHHLPKAHYPALAVVPINLIPACLDCNKIKLDAIPKLAEEQTLHPYFDNIEDEKWLSAKVIECSPPIISFAVESPGNWDVLKFDRVQHHFNVFRLGNLYASQAATELINIFNRIDILFSLAGEKAVQNHLTAEARSRQTAHLNSWQTAMYEAIANSEWFCSGGFKKLK
jgi:5-methylcytosine-specific restriction endonuclease McrA